MLLYFFFFFWILFYFVNPTSVLNRKLLLFFLGLFLCTSYMAGSDWVNYELDYQFAIRNEIIDDRKEPGYYMFRSIFAKSGIDFWWFFISTKLVCFYIYMKFLLKYGSKNFAWGLLYMFSYVFLDLFINCPFRSLIAGSFMLVGINRLLQGKKLHFWVISLISMTFHYSMVIFAPITFFLCSIKQSFPKKIVLFSIPAIYVFFFFFWRIGLAEKLLVYQVLLMGDSKSIYYLLEQGSVFSIGMWAVMLFYLWMVFGLNLERLSEKEKIIYNLSVLYMAFYVISFFIPIFTRLALYLTLPFGCFLSFGLANIRHNRMKNIATFAMTLFLALSMKGALTRDERYVPYTSYLQYIGQEKPSYGERVNYNHRNSPYHSDKEGGVTIMQ